VITNHENIFFTVVTLMVAL